MPKPVPSRLLRTYPPQGPLTQFRFAESTSFVCFRCGSPKVSKLLCVYGGDWSKLLCSGCYGGLLFIYETKSGATADDARAEALVRALLSCVSGDEERRALLRFKVSEHRAQYLTPAALRFIATAEHVAESLDAAPQLEWSPAVIGLCKAVETELVNRILGPVIAAIDPTHLVNDRRDKDIGRVASYIADPTSKPPELGAIAYFLQTVAHSEKRREQAC